MNYTLLGAPVACRSKRRQFVNNGNWKRDDSHADEARLRASGGRHRAGLAFGLGQGGGHGGQRALIGERERGELVEHLQLDGQRAVGGASDARFGAGEFAGGQAHGVRHGLAVAEGLV
ncbi:MAG: hypothetical protein P8Y36_02060 [Alphaproteobacteria bacterium]